MEIYLIKKEWEKLLVESASLGVHFSEKSGLIWGLIGKFLFLFGATEFMTFITTIGRTIYFPAGQLKELSSTALGCEVLSHELVHVRQFKKFGLGSARLGVVPMGVVYLLFPIPVLACFGRWWIESPAYVKGINTRLRVDPIHAPSKSWYVSWATKMMTGGAYGFALKLFPGTVKRYFEEHIIDCHSAPTTQKPA